MSSEYFPKLYDGINYDWSMTVDGLYTSRNLPKHPEIHSFIGVLDGCKSCVITEELNGIYDLEIEYVVGSAYYDKLIPGNLIEARMVYTTINYGLIAKNLKPQFFRIYEVSRTLDSVQVLAHHVSYELSWYQILPFSAVSNLSSAFSALTTNCTNPSNPFLLTYSGNFPALAYTYRGAGSLRNYLGGQEGSILDIFGGEWEWDNLTCKLYKQRGSDKGVMIDYGYSMSQYNQRVSNNDAYQGVCLSYYDTEDPSTAVSAYVSDSSGGTGDGKLTRFATIDITEEYKNRGVVPTQADLLAEAQSWLSNHPNINDLNVSLDAKYIINPNSYYSHVLTQNRDVMQEYVYLGDTVTINNALYGLYGLKLRVVAIEYDVLNQKNISIEVSQPKQTLAKTISNLQIKQENMESDKAI